MGDKTLRIEDIPEGERSQMRLKSEDLLKILQDNTRDIQERINAMFELRICGTTEILDILMEYVDDDKFGIFPVLALGQIGNQVAVEYRKIESGKERKRVVVSRIGEERVIDTLEKKLYSSNPWISYRSAEALSRIAHKSTKAIRILLKAAINDNPTIRHCTIEGAIHGGQWFIGAYFIPLLLEKREELGQDPYVCCGVGSFLRCYGPHRKEAIKEYRKALNQLPNNAFAHFLLGDLMMGESVNASTLFRDKVSSKKYHDMAVVELNRAIDLDITDPSPHFSFCNSSSDFNEMKPHYAVALLLDRNKSIEFRWEHSEYGISAAKQRQFDVARRAFLREHIVWQPNIDERYGTTVPGDPTAYQYWLEAKSMLPAYLNNPTMIDKLWHE